MQNTKIWPNQSSSVGTSGKQPSFVSDCNNFWDDDFIIFHLSRPSLAKDLQWFDSRKPPPPVSYTMSSHFGWSLITEDLTVQSTSAQNHLPTHPPTQRPVEYLPSRRWLGGGWKSAGGVSYCYMKTVQFTASSTSLLTVSCFRFR